MNYKNQKMRCSVSSEQISDTDFSEQISGQNSGKSFTSGNVLPKKLWVNDAFANQLEHCWHGT